MPDKYLTIPVGFWSTSLRTALLQVKDGLNVWSGLKLINHLIKLSHCSLPSRGTQCLWHNEAGIFRYFLSLRPHGPAWSYFWSELWHFCQAGNKRTMAGHFRLHIFSRQIWSSNVIKMSGRYQNISIMPGCKIFYFLAFMPTEGNEYLVTFCWTPCKFFCDLVMQQWKNITFTLSQ